MSTVSELAHDHLHLDSLLSPDELELRARVRSSVDERTHEGTDEVHTLITGRAVTGVPALAPGPWSPSADPRCATP